MKKFILLAILIATLHLFSEVVVGNLYQYAADTGYGMGEWADCNQNIVIDVESATVTISGLKYNVIKLLLDTRGDDFFITTTRVRTPDGEYAKLSIITYDNGMNYVSVEFSNGSMLYKVLW